MPRSPYSSRAITWRPAAEAQMPVSTPASPSARRMRAAYGAPDAPVIPSITRMSGSLLRGRRAGLQTVDERDQAVDLLFGQLVAEGGHAAAAVFDLAADVLNRRPRGAVAQIG